MEDVVTLIGKDGDQKKSCVDEMADLRETINHEVVATLVLALIRCTSNGSSCFA